MKEKIDLKVWQVTKITLEEISIDMLYKLVEHLNINMFSKGAITDVSKELKDGHIALTFELSEIFHKNFLNTRISCTIHRALDSVNTWGCTPTLILKPTGGTQDFYFTSHLIEYKCGNWHTVK